MKRWRCVAVAMGAAALVLVACAPASAAGEWVPAGAVHGTVGGPGAQAPEQGPCLQNAARCGGAGSMVVPGTAVGASLLFVLGWSALPAALTRRVRRTHSRSWVLPAGSPLLVMRPPRLISATL